MRAASDFDRSSELGRPVAETPAAHAGQAARSISGAAVGDLRDAAVVAAVVVAVGAVAIGDADRLMLDLDAGEDAADDDVADDDPAESDAAAADEAKVDPAEYDFADDEADGDGDSIDLGIDDE